MSKKKLIIFDFDGTIVDSFKITVGTLNEIAPKYGLKKVLIEDLPRLRNLSSRELLAEWKIPFWKMFFVVRAAKKEFSKQLDRVAPFSGIGEVLAELKKRGYLLCVLTSNSQENIENFINQHNLSIFDEVRGDCGLFEKSKFMRKFLQKFNCDASEALSVGDETRDIEAAKKCQITCVAVSYGFNSKQVLEKFQPDYLIDRPEELLTINF